MRALWASFGLGLVLVGSAAQAEDSRLRVEPFPGNRVMRIAGRIGVQAVVAFGADEHIENVAIGDAAAWQVTPNKRANMLFLKPLLPRAVTNLTVVTDRHAYFFDLAAAPGAKALYSLKFTYPESEKARLATPVPPLTAEEGRLAAGEKTAVPTDLAALDFGWKRKGKAALLPVRVYADGRDTYLDWPAKSPLPAVLQVDEKGNESPLNFAVRAEMIVIEGVPSRIVLRAGKDVATIDHVRPEPPAAPLANAGDAKQDKVERP